MKLLDIVPCKIKDIVAGYIKDIEACEPHPKKLRLTIILLIALSYICIGQINYTHVLISEDSLNYSINNDVAVFEIPNQEFPYRWEIYAITYPVETSNEDTNYRVFEAAKYDRPDSATVWVPITAEIDPGAKGDKIKGSSEGGRIKLLAYKNANGNSIGFKVYARIQWIKAKTNYNELSLP